jgi:hypothetical protein
LCAGFGGIKMCQIVKYKDKELETPLDLHNSGIKTIVLSPSHKTIVLDACLCQVSVDETLRANNLKWVNDGYDYYVKD